MKNYGFAFVIIMLLLNSCQAVQPTLAPSPTPPICPNLPRFLRSISPSITFFKNSVS